MDKLIQVVADALDKGWTVESLHDAILTKGWSEDDAFLAIKAGQLLLKSIKEAEAAKKQSPFRRVP